MVVAAPLRRRHARQRALLLLLVLALVTVASLGFVLVASAWGSAYAERGGQALGARGGGAEPPRGGPAASRFVVLQVCAAPFFRPGCLTTAPRLLYTRLPGCWRPNRSCWLRCARARHVNVGEGFACWLLRAARNGVLDVGVGARDATTWHVRLTLAAP